MLWVEDGESADALAPLNEAASVLAAAAAAARPLTIPSGRRAVWAWLATRGQPDLAELREAASASGVRVAIGTPSAGIDGFRQSHREAVDETVAAYLDHGGSVEATASTLIVHKNTIRYRLAQAEELIGHPLSDRRIELALALRCLETYG